MIMQQHAFTSIAPFSLSATYTELYADSPENVNAPHVHDCCELYVNVSGDVSFLVENRIYPLCPGDVILTRPFEYHHCIYNSNRLHKHFWILISAQGNESLMPAFFDRPLGERNRLSLLGQDAQALFRICHRLCEFQLPQGEQYHYFFSLLHLLQNASAPQVGNGDYPLPLLCAIQRIQRDFSLPLTVQALAQEAHVSVNTLERYFQRYLKLSPTVYLRKKRLGHAAMLLSQGESVTNASQKSGFSDDSRFISLFRQSYGITPLQYQKREKPERI